MHSPVCFKRPRLVVPAAAVVVALIAPPSLAQPVPILEVNAFVGPGAGPGDADGTGSGARFNNPQGIAVDAAGNLFVSDTDNHTIRRITPAGVVTTIAGLSGAPGSSEVPFPLQSPNARFDTPTGIAVDAQGTLLVVDRQNNTIRKVSQDGWVSYHAGLPTQSALTGIALDAQGSAFVSDAERHLVYKVAPGGYSWSVLAGTDFTPGSIDGAGQAARFNQPAGVALDQAGHLFVADRGNHTIRKITPAGVVTTYAGQPGVNGVDDGPVADARFDQPTAVAVDRHDVVWVVELYGTIRRITPDGQVTTVAGAYGPTGAEDGIGSAAQFAYPMAIAVDASGVAYVADSGNHTVRKVTPAGVVSTLAGLAPRRGHVDASWDAARFDFPYGLAIDSAGNLLVADWNSHTIRKVSPDAEVTTIAGMEGHPGYVDGTGASARFERPGGLAIDADDNLYVADQGSHAIRKIAPDRSVTTVAVIPGAVSGVAVAADGTIYTSDTQRHVLWRVSPAGAVTLFAGRLDEPGRVDGPAATATFAEPTGLVLDGSGTLFVGEWSGAVRRVSPLGEVSTLLDGRSSINGLAIDPEGNLLVCEQSAHALLVVSQSGRVSVAAGRPGTRGSRLGAGSAARLTHPAAVTLDGEGRVYLATVGNHSIYRGRLEPGGHIHVEAELVRGAYGTVLGEAGGVACPGHCDAYLPASHTLVLVAHTAVNALFTGWSGACAGVSSCGVVANDTRVARATFTPKTFTLRVGTRGPKPGLVNSIPGGIWCGNGETRCDHVFDYGWVYLEPHATAGGTFSGWLGDCISSPGAPPGPPSDACLHLLTKDASIAALFTDPDIDADLDALPDEWEAFFGLAADSGSGADGPGGDPDLDSVINLDEHDAGSHPRGFHTRFLAEGATSEFFDTRVALANPTVTPASVVLRFQKRDGSTVGHPVPLGPTSHAHVAVNAVAGMAHAEFSMVVESDVPVVAERTMTWDESRYGSHAETAVERPALQWFLAEGATHSGFDLFYLLQNPSGIAANVEVRYLRPTGAPLVRTYTVEASRRFTIWVDFEDPALASTDVSAVITSTNGVPIVVERAMYLDTADHHWAAGHASAGVITPSTQWLLAEGATGSYFDLFVLIANPGDVPAAVTASYLLDTGAVVTKSYTVAANSRFNIWVDYEDAALADTAVSTLVQSTNAVPVIVERAMWWPGTPATWTEAHNSAGATSSGTQWALAGGEVGNVDDIDTYILVANRSTFEGRAAVTLLFADGTTAVRAFDLPAHSRTNVAVREAFGGVVEDRRFGALVESLAVDQGTAQIVVERATYASPGQHHWVAGTSALATKLR